MFMSFISEFLLILEYFSTGIREIPQIKYALVFFKAMQRNTNLSPAFSVQ